MDKRLVAIMLAFAAVVLLFGDGSIAAPSEAKSQVEAVGLSGDQVDAISSDDDVSRQEEDELSEEEWRQRYLNDPSVDNRERCARKVANGFYETYYNVMSMMNLELYNRVHEARKHYHDKDFQGVVPAPLEVCDDVRIEVEKGLRAADHCSYEFTRTEADKNAFLLIISGKNSYTPDAIELDLACRHGTKTGEILREMGLFDMYAEKMLRLDGFEFWDRIRHRYMDELAAAYSEAYDQLVCIMTDESWALLKRVRGFYKEPKVVREEPVSRSEVCKELEKHVFEPTEETGGDGVLYSPQLLGRSYPLTFTQLAMKDERIRVVFEMYAICHSGENAVQYLHQAGIFDVIADPQRMAELESKGEVEYSA